MLNYGKQCSDYRLSFFHHFLSILGIGIPTITVLLGYSPNQTDMYHVHDQVFTLCLKSVLCECLVHFSAFHNYVNPRTKNHLSVPVLKIQFRMNTLVFTISDKSNSCVTPDTAPIFTDSLDKHM